MSEQELRKIIDAHGAWLRGEGGARANLRGTDLSDADLSGADLSRTDLSRANLSGADLSGAHLREANLRRADLSEANLRGTDLSGAHLRGANLRGTDLRGAKNIPAVVCAQTSILPDSGSAIGWKKLQGGLIAKLRINEDTPRSNATGRKCRAERADVLAIFDKSGNEVQSGLSNHDASFEYKTGETVIAKNWSDDRWQECAGGIHFFITRIEAEEY